MVTLFEQALAHSDDDYKPAPRFFSEIFEFFDSFIDLGCLIFTPAINAYRPYNREWLKEKLFEHLRRENHIIKFPR
ncbi:MAG: hypothetical protein EZS28_030787 [Streblomastix strix]|uniref:Uncharacterized protein n=1 Tax=Streblomastix strix TaxID=222440 RepID=A0A5J4USR0_9EUKA|nr:MAG: hypothetical protein EZS28_054026 [Streblomastix strix]KAA6373686.1 MAG: hypothetical protein EZS28_030784 [Streblomastix strix]KAA6373689.1 MAG: hypothetical protein EZS28_030787 [Streblomastix strix]